MQYLGISWELLQRHILHDLEKDMWDGSGMGGQRMEAGSGGGRVCVCARARCTINEG